jgi:hypothetical protein
VLIGIAVLYLGRAVLLPITLARAAAEFFSFSGNGSPATLGTEKDFLRRCWSSAFLSLHWFWCAGLDWDKLTIFRLSFLLTVTISAPSCDR